jgi:hypothetical protein
MMSFYVFYFLLLSFYIFILFDLLRSFFYTWYFFLSTTLFLCGWNCFLLKWSETSIIFLYFADYYPPAWLHGVVVEQRSSELLVRVRSCLNSVFILFTITIFSSIFRHGKRGRRRGSDAGLVVADRPKCSCETAQVRAMGKINFGNSGVGTALRAYTCHPGRHVDAPPQPLEKLWTSRLLESTDLFP